MPIAGRLTDRTGAGRIVLVGLTLVTLGTIPLTQVSFTSSYWLVSGALFVRGLGMGATMMPSMSAAMQTLTHAAIPRATTALNIVMRVGGAIGTALLAVVLQHQITQRLPVASGRGLGAAQNVGPAARAHVGPALADAFAHTFWWAIALTVLAFIPAVLLPRHKPELPAEEERPPDAAAEEVPEPIGV
jgi:MFS family permease